jgi:hypothetical protein
MRTQYLLLSHGNSSLKIAPQCYVIHTLHVLLFLTAGCAVADGIFLYSCGDKEVVQYDPNNSDAGECFLNLNTMMETENIRGSFM